MLGCLVIPLLLLWLVGLLIYGLATGRDPRVDP